MRVLETRTKGDRSLASVIALMTSGVFWAQQFSAKKSDSTAKHSSELYLIIEEPYVEIVSNELMF